MNSTLEPQITLNVDVKNPGQYFACCGLFELAHRLWPGSEAWFASQKFSISVLSTEDDFTLDRIIRTLTSVKLQVDSIRGESAYYAVRIVNPGELDVLLDWWLGNSDKASALKLWAGNQNSLGILQTLKSSLLAFPLASVDSLLDWSTPLTSRFGLDPRSAWNALDVGFSPNEHGMPAASYPFVEMLAAIGLQRFRPLKAAPTTTPLEWGYSTWSKAVPIQIATAVSEGITTAGDARRYVFRISERGSYKGFTFSRTKENNDGQR